MDSHLLTLWNKNIEGSVKIEQIADDIQLSTKQTRRKLSRWEEDGWLTFESGKGRGHTSYLRWKRQVEEEYEQCFLDILNQNTIEQVSKWLLLDWSQDTKHRIMTSFQSKFGFQQHNQDSLIIPKFYKAMTTHPLEVVDVHSANLVANIFNRVVTLQADGTISPELAHSWEYTNTSLTLYLRKDVTFHDGSILKAEDVVESFWRMKLNDHFKTLWIPITNIFSPSPLVVQLDFPFHCSYVLQLVSLITASIFKEAKGKIIGTGGFYLEENSEEKTVLCAFSRHFANRPLLDRVEFIKVPDDFKIVYYGANESSNVSTFEVESDSGFGIVLLNPHRHKDMARKEVRNYIHMLIANHRDELSQIDKRLKANHEGCLIGYSETYSLHNIQTVTTEEPIRMRYSKHTSSSSFWLKELLERHGFTVEIEEIAFEESIYRFDPINDADIFIHGEIFELNQIFSYFYFLKNSYSPLHAFIKLDSFLQQELRFYQTLPFDQWPIQHLKIEQYLRDESICIPLYYIKRQIPFSINLKNIESKHFGYVDLTKLWMKPAR